MDGNYGAGRRAMHCRWVHPAGTDQLVERPGVRWDSHAQVGYSVPPHYDSLVGKLIVHGKSRNECLMRLRRALDELVVGGIETTIPLFQELIKQPDILDGAYNIHWLENYLECDLEGSDELQREARTEITGANFKLMDEVDPKGIGIFSAWSYLFKPQYWTPEVIRDGLLRAIENVENYLKGKPTDVVVAPVKTRR